MMGSRTELERVLERAELHRDTLLHAAHAKPTRMACRSPIRNQFGLQAACPCQTLAVDHPLEINMAWNQHLDLTVFVPWDRTTFGVEGPN